MNTPTTLSATTTTTRRPETGWEKSDCSHEPGPSGCLYCTRCVFRYCLWHLLSVKNIWFHYPPWKRRDSKLKADRGQGVDFGYPPKPFFLQFTTLLFNFSFLALADVMFASSPQKKEKEDLFTLVEKPQKCCGMSHHIGRAWRWVFSSSSPATGGEAADRHPLRQMHVDLQ